MLGEWRLLARILAGVIAATVVMPHHAAAAVAMPNWDIVKSCKDTPNHAICEQIERGAKSDLAGRWGVMSDDKRSQCISRGEASNHSYVAVAACAKE